MSYKKAYTISYDKETDQWYCHMVGYPSVPVMGSFGSKRKAQRMANQFNLMDEQVKRKRRITNDNR